MDRLIRGASRRASQSADEAQRLLGVGSAGPAYVWAVRSLEIFVKETMLLPLLLERSNENALDDAWPHVWAQLRDTFRSGKWDRALRLVGQAYGPLAPMMTDSGEDVWSVWKNRVIPRRGDIAHGWVEAPSFEETALVLLWAKQLMDQLRLRLIAGGKHPLHDLFVAALEPAI